MSIADRKSVSTWCGRSLTNYKEMHKETARKKGVEAALQNARTLTQAKKALFGIKKGATR